MRHRARPRAHLLPSTRCPPPPDRRLTNLRAALGFLQLAPRAHELRLLHRWLDTWTGVGLITVGVERLGHRLSLAHVADAEWRAAFVGHRLFAPVGYGVAATPWDAVQRAAWADSAACPPPTRSLGACSSVSAPVVGFSAEACRTSPRVP
jgi:hypothetical protein